jgi:DHA1 family tetracycline resistance protein-like MFS transporter
MIGVGILIPIIPYLFDTNSVYNILPSFLDNSYSYLWQGIALAVYPLCQFFMTPILGEISDHFGRKKILLFCIVGTFIGYLLTAYSILAHSLSWFLIGRAIDGISGGNISIAMASIADVSKPEEKARNFGLIGAAFGIGFVVGPALGGVIATTFNASAPFYFAAFLSVINFLAVFYFIRETVAKAVGKVFKLNISQSVRNVITGFKMKEMRNIFTIQMLYTSSFAFYTSFAGVYMKERFGFSLGDIGYYFALVGICIALTQGLVVPRVFNKKLKDVEILFRALIVFALVILVFIFNTYLIINLLFVPVFTVAIGLANTAIGAISSKKAPPNIQGRIIGINSSIQAIAGTIPQFLAGIAATYLVYYAPLIATVILVVTGLYFVQKEKNATV